MSRINILVIHHVDSELLCFRPGKQHALVQRVEKAFLGNPPLSFDQFRMHDRNLASRPAEADESQLDPEMERLPERRRLQRL